MLLKIQVNFFYNGFYSTNLTVDRLTIFFSFNSVFDDPLQRNNSTKHQNVHVFCFNFLKISSFSAYFAFFIIFDLPTPSDRLSNQYVEHWVFFHYIWIFLAWLNFSLICTKVRLQIYPVNITFTFYISVCICFLLFAFCCRLDISNLCLHLILGLLNLFRINWAYSYHMCQWAWTDKLGS